MIKCLNFTMNVLGKVKLYGYTPDFHLKKYNNEIENYSEFD